MQRFLDTVISKKYILVLILILAATIRIWGLWNVPPGTSNDEASIGYNAYSVSKIGVDEYGSFPLVSQRAYDDWRRSTYLLMDVPFVAVLGLRNVAIRLPAVILGILTVWATYEIVLLLFKKQTHTAQAAALLASLLLALSPWHVYISRLGHESNAYLSFFVFGVLFFLRGLKSRFTIFISFLFFMLSLISYYAGQAIVPLLAMGILVIYWQELIDLLNSDKRMLYGFIVFLVILGPVLWSVFSPAAMIRFAGTSTFSASAHPQEYDHMVALRNAAAARGDILGEVLNNRRLFPVRVFLEGYISHFDPRWLFTNSGAESFKIPNMGLLNIWELPLILIGIVAFAFRKDVDAKAKKLIFLWILLAPVPAAIATQAPHAMRAYAMLPVWQIFSAFGVLYIFRNSKALKTVLAVVFFVVVAWDIRTLYVNYYVLFPKEQSESFYYAMSEAVPYANAHAGGYDNVVISNQGSLYQSYMAYLYYSRYDPALYRSQGGTISGGFAETHHFSKYEFRPIIWAKEKRDGKTLYIGNVTDFPKGTGIAAFASLDGKTTIIAASR